ncbi:MAG: hypothetical protein ACJ77A_05300 [Actinomycetota bacterium]
MSISDALAGRTGRPLGLNAGEAVVPVAVADSVSEEARDWAANANPVKFAVLCHPVIVDTGRRDVCFRRRPRVLGLAYFRFMKQVIQDEVIAAVEFG